MVMNEARPVGTRIRGTTTLSTPVTRFEDANNFIGVARFVCEHVNRTLDAATCGVSLHRTSGGPYILVDNFSSSFDTYRLTTVHEARYLDNPLFDGLRDHGGMTSATSIDMARFGEFAPDLAREPVHPFVAPLLDAAGLVGSIQIWSRTPYTGSLERAVTTLATRASVRLAQIGVGAITHVPTRLTARQYEIARLVATGDTNSEIGTKLSISANTVKAQLKDIFERLGIHCRVELVNVLAREAPPLGVPAGVTRIVGGITVTRAP